jgi:hypothetical protein
VPTASATTETTSPPPAVASWLAAVEARIERGERLTDPSVESVTAALDADDVDVADLASRTAADAAALRTVAARVATLEERAAAVDVPVDALRRLP